MNKTKEKKFSFIKVFNHWTPPPPLVLLYLLPFNSKHLHANDTDVNASNLDESAECLDIRF